MSLVYTKTDVLLRVEHVSLSFGDRLVLRDVDAEIRNIVRPDCIAGQVVCFLGPSGIGKTQLSRIIAGLQRPTLGRVLLRDDSVSPFMQQRNHLPFPGAETRPGWVGMVPQSYPLFPFATVRENFEVAARQGERLTDVGGSRIRELAEAFDLGAYLDDYPRALSGGTRQRVALVRQLLCAGHYLVLDEPFSGLDPEMKHEACELITRAANQDDRNTVIVVTHDIPEGLSVADTVWLMGREPGQPGARLVKQYDLAAEDLCWHPEIMQDVRFQQFVAQVRGEFKTLKG